MTTMIDTSPLAALLILLRALKLPTIARHAEEVAQLAERDGWTFIRYLHHLVELEGDERRRRRIERSPKRRTFTAEYKLRVLREADAALASGAEGAIGELLRREGLYSSHLTEWRRQREAGELAGLAAKKRGPKAKKNPLADENARLRRENERLQNELAKANTVIDVQRKVAALLGETLPEPTEEEIELGRGRFRLGRLDIKSGRRS